MDLCLSSPVHGDHGSLQCESPQPTSRNHTLNGRESIGVTARYNILRNPVSPSQSPRSQAWVIIQSLKYSRDLLRCRGVSTSSPDTTGNVRPVVRRTTSYFPPNGSPSVAHLEACPNDTAFFISGHSPASFTPGGAHRWMNSELLFPEEFRMTDNLPTSQSDCYARLYEVRVHVVWFATPHQKNSTIPRF